VESGGLHTCSQEAWGQWFVTVAKHLDPPDELMLFCGVALGHMDDAAPINRLDSSKNLLKSVDF